MSIPSENANKRIQEIKKNIQDEYQSKGGQDARARIRAAKSSFDNLQSDLSSGKLSQQDYISIADAVYPEEERHIRQIAGSGSNGANAARDAGGYDLIENVGRDYNIYKTGRELLGRDVTQDEVYALRPKFTGPNGMDTGKAYLAEYAKQEQNSPAALQKKAGGYSGDVNGTFQTLLSRGATKDEVDYFGRMLASGQVTPYEINNFVQQLPEYQNQQDTKFRSGLEGELAGYDSKAFGREKENILSRYTQAGIQNSSALDFAITDALGKMTENRGKFIAGLSSQQYGGNKDAARSDYQTSVDRMYGQQDYGQQKSDAYLDYLTKRADSGTDYARQRDDYMSFMNNQPKQKTSPFDYLNAGLNTVNTGANLYRTFSGGY